jgi:hypothetical protein
MDKLNKFIEEIRNEILINPIASKMGYKERLEGKINRLLYYFPEFSPKLFNFFREILFNVSIKDSDLVNVLKFLDKLRMEERRNLNILFGLIWQEFDPKIKGIGLSEDKYLREEYKDELFSKITLIRLCSKKVKFNKRNVKRTVKMWKILKPLPIIDILKIVNISPHIIKGLRKTPRPLYSWIIPVVFSIPLISILLNLNPDISIFRLNLILILFILIGTYFISMHFKISPGILYYKKTRDYLLKAVKGEFKESKLEYKMKKSGINLDEIQKEIIYENENIRIILRNKKTLEGAIKFLISSDEIGSCIALENFVSWTLPFLLNDDSIFLADVFYKSKAGYFNQRAQIWMIASLENNTPVLVINSFEFNELSAKHIDELMPEMINFVKEVAKRGNFKKIYAGISTFGRKYLDENFKQADKNKRIVKIHIKELGYKYYFDVFKLRFNWKFRRLEFGYIIKRGLLRKTYALIFGLRELIRGNSYKAKAFFDTVKNSNNFWEIKFLN